MKDLIGMGQDVITKNKVKEAKKMFGINEAKREDTDPSVGDRNEVTHANKAGKVIKSRVADPDDDSIEAGSINDESGAHKAARELKWNDIEFLKIILNFTLKIFI